MTTVPRAQHVPVVIVGAGPTGATAAIMLAQRGIRCLLLERWPQVYPLPRAVHFDDEVFRIFATLGIAEPVRAISRPAAGMQLVDAQLRVLAEFSRDLYGGAHGYPQANMFDQPELEQLLRNRLAELPDVELRGGVDVLSVDQPPGGPAPVRVRFRDTNTGDVAHVWADAVLGCDGANSGTRDGIGATMQDLGFTQQWLVIDVHSPQPLHSYEGVQQVCDFDRAATFMLVTPGRYRWEFRLRASEKPDEIDDAQVIELIRPWLGGVDPDKLTVLRRTWYTFRGAMADRWRDRRVFLLGDAAHLTPPFIGQGMCAGIRDAANLTWKLALVLTAQADDRLLATYEAERRPYARRVIQMAIRVGWLMTGGTARSARLRRAALRFVARLPGANSKVLDVAWPAFPAGPLTARKDRAAGRLCPQPRVHTASGMVPLDQLLGDAFAIVYRGHRRLATTDPPTRAFFDAIGVSEIHLADPATGAAADSVVDIDGALTALLDQAGAHALLLRPDRVVAASAKRADLHTWRRQLHAAGFTG
jgi:3-(3-hydroxy-phenyl)propionate hydroxylase